MPCPTASRDALQALQNLVEREPGTVLDLDLDAMTVRAGDAAFPISLPAAARQALRDGTWDATGLLLENFEEVRAVAARLPYVSARW
jgi:3-isopropylmalate/(R)-2-methylmalate dehydratase small subunit